MGRTRQEDKLLHAKKSTDTNTFKAAGVLVVVEWGGVWGGGRWGRGGEGNDTPVCCQLAEQSGKYAYTVNGNSSKPRQTD